MTEGDPKMLDVFARQGILGGTKVPVIWGLTGDVGTALTHNEKGIYSQM